MKQYQVINCKVYPNKQGKGTPVSDEACQKGSHPIIFNIHHFLPPTFILGTPKHFTACIGFHSEVMDKDIQLINI